MREKPSILLPALYGGVVIGFLIGIPILNYVNACCCAGVLIGGALSVFFYKKDLMPDMPPLESSDAVKLGALAGAIGGVFGTVLGQLIQLTSGTDAASEMDKAIDEMSSRPGTEGAIQFMEMIRSFMESPFFLLVGLIFSVVLCTLFGLLGGLIGYAIFKPKQQMMNAMPPQPPTQML